MLGDGRMDKLKMNFDAAAAAPPNGSPQPGEGGRKPPKIKPLSKRISSSIAMCSSKMTEIMSWQAKLAENKGDLKLG